MESAPSQVTTGSFQEGKARDEQLIVNNKASIKLAFL
jgi:hypothetical protein